MLCLPWFVYIGDFKLSQLSCFSSLVGRASHLEYMRHGFTSHLSAAFSLEKVVSGLVSCCVVLCCVVLLYLSFPAFSPSEHLSMHVIVYDLIRGIIKGMEEELGNEAMCMHIYHMCVMPV